MLIPHILQGQKLLPLRAVFGLRLAKSGFFAKGSEVMQRNRTTHLGLPNIILSSPSNKLIADNGKSVLYLESDELFAKKCRSKNKPRDEVLPKC